MSDRVATERRKVADNLATILAKPFEPEPRADGITYGDDAFDPWDLFPGVYGSYSSDFDDCAIDILNELQAKTKVRSDLGAEMFREMLCVAGLCEYGASPRACFWDQAPELLTELIGKWSEYRRREWSDDSKEPSSD